jgi:hypothetical protein
MPRPVQPQGERLRPKSEGSRLFWTPLEPHALDGLEQEVQALDEEIPARITSLLKEVQHTHQRLEAILAQEQEQQPDPTDPFSRADRHATQLVQERFGNRKHLKHLQAFFALLRRRRLLGRLRTIEAALHLVNGLVAQEETLSHQLLTAMHEAGVCTW